MYSSLSVFPTTDRKYTSSSSKQTEFIDRSENSLALLLLPPPERTISVAVTSSESWSLRSEKDELSYYYHITKA